VLAEADGGHLQEAALDGGAEVRVGLDPVDEHHPVASEAILSMYTGTPRSVSPSSTTSMEDRIGAPQNSSGYAQDSRISTCPSAVAPPWLPIAGH
jgi:hypothetical protein